jgi:Mce-associated membrane protein
VATSNNTGSAADDLLAEAEAAEAEGAQAEGAQAEAAQPEAAGKAEPLQFPEEFELDDEHGSGLRIWRAVGAGVGVLALIALLSVGGLLIWHHRQAVQRDEQSTAYATAARRGVVNLMSLNFNHTQDDLQRVIASTTGPFHDDFEKRKNDFLSVMKQSKVVATSEVKATGVESVDGDSAVVLVAASSQVANSASQQPTPRAWRLSVTVNKESDGIKMSKVEFVP